jgi:hypothetical protein
MRGRHGHGRSGQHSKEGEDEIQTLGKEQEDALPCDTPGLQGRRNPAYTSGKSAKSQDIVLGFTVAEKPEYNVIGLSVAAAEDNVDHGGGRRSTLREHIPGTHNRRTRMPFLGVLQPLIHG